MFLRAVLEKVRTEFAIFDNRNKILWRVGVQLDVFLCKCAQKQVHGSSSYKRISKG